ncbi:hypothetical protein BKP35_08150 [Anaerobacillus arseniciselenatis]|uniref:Uncharacterized protein n=1 Tax=Anaerobacillus arseniciselenatis TaxID=85682 RepID=A0A1S2LNQ8_9BACI|nr:hypothetical protein [Anaerobacillus arseniciselenatis]OIJ14158.1 hypothetical protein BKP35_08150 [Anaerobacillus arseniciselenatis]
MQINIRNIRINSISTIGSLNIGKTVFSDNQASSAQFPKPNYEETEPENEDNNENEQNNNDGENIEFQPPMDAPPIYIP